MVRSAQQVLFYLSAIRRFKKNVEEKKERKENNSDNIKVHLAIFDMIMKLENTDFIYLFPV